MAVAIASVASTAPNTAASGTITITKPTGLALNEVMIAVLQHEFGTLTTPAGWTRYTSSSFTSIYGKVANAGDVAASNFSWAETGVDEGGGTIYRFTGASFSAIQVFTGSDSGGTTAEFAVTAVPHVTNSILVINGQVAGSGVGNAFSNISDFFVTGGVTPTFTGRTFARSAGDNYNLGLADAPYASAATITAFGFNDPDSNNQFGTMLIVPPQGDASGSNTLATTTATTFAQTGTCDGTAGNTLLETNTTMFTQTGTGTSPTQWTNEVKPSTTWVNKTK